MNNVYASDKCPVCGGRKEAGKTIFSVDLGFGVVVVRDVPASVCSQCGADWIDDRIAADLEEIISDARERQHLVEVTSFRVSLSNQESHPSR